MSEEEAIAALEPEDEVADDLGDAAATGVNDAGVAEHLGHKVR